MMESVLHNLYDWSYPALASLFLLENALIAVLSVMLGFWLDGTLQELPLISKHELFWALSTICFNTMVTLSGFELFREGFIHFNFKAQTYWIIIDFCLLVIIMDLLMYIFHYLIHKLKFVHRIHDLHHLYTCPTPVSLYVLHPVEVLGFGALWLSLLTSMHFSLYAVVLYLIFNVLMGILGHMQVSILPETFRHHMVLRWLATTRFHRGHHSYSQSNYGFYTSIWDRLFGTWKD